MAISKDDPFPELVTVALRGIGALRKGIEVQETEVLTTPLSPGKVRRFAIRNPGETVHSSPLSLIAKRGSSIKEYVFYTQLSPRLPPGIVPECYHAVYDSEHDESLLVLEDLSRAYRQPPWPIPPSVQDCEAAIARLAAIHATWWNDRESLHSLTKSIPPVKTWRHRYRLAAEKLPEFLHEMGDRLASSRRDILKRISACSEQAHHPRETFTHGDAHLWNFLFSHDGGVRLLDWSSWDVRKGTDDLAYMMALHWYPERRERLEESLVHLYYQRLLQHGITGLDWNDCWTDYRGSCLLTPLIPVWQWAVGIHPSVWWFHLERSFLALEDLDCLELASDA